MCVNADRDGILDLHGRNSWLLDIRYWVWPTDDTSDDLGWHSQAD